MYVAMVFKRKRAQLNEHMSFVAEHCRQVLMSNLTPLHPEESAFFVDVVTLAYT